MMRSPVRYGYLPLMLLAINGAAIALAGRGFGEAYLAAPIAVAVALSFAAERVLPYEPEWNTARGDGGRDAAHAFVNEAMILLGVAVIPLLAAITPFRGWWPAGLPFGLQVLGSVLVADLGITWCTWPATTCRGCGGSTRCTTACCGSTASTA